MVNKIGKLEEFSVFPYIVGDDINEDIVHHIGESSVTSSDSYILNINWDKTPSSCLYNGINVIDAVLMSNRNHLFCGVSLGLQGKASLLFGDSKIKDLSFNRGPVAKDYLQDRTIYAFFVELSAKVLENKNIDSSLKFKGLEELANDGCLSMFFRHKEVERFKNQFKEIYDKLYSLGESEIINEVLKN